MRSSLRALAFGLVLLAPLARGAAAQTPARQQLVVPLTAGAGFVGFRLEAKLDAEREGAQGQATSGARGQARNFVEVEVALTPQALLDEGNTIHRVVLDHAGNVVFGYDLVVTPAQEPLKFSVAARPLGADFERTLRARRGQPVQDSTRQGSPSPKATAASADTPDTSTTNTAPQDAPLNAAARGATNSSTNGATNSSTNGAANSPAGARAESAVPTLARASAPQLLEDGDAVELDLLVNPRTGVRVVDVIRVARDRARLWQSRPRDFTLDSVEIAVSDPRLVVNGELLASSNARREVAGSLVWFYVPGRGRFVLSLVARAGYDFRKVALIEGNRASFDYKGDHYEWVSSAPIVGNGGDWYAWVLFDPNYTPEVTTAEEIARDADKSNGEEEPGTLAKIINGEPPRTDQSRAGFGEKRGGSEPRVARLRVRFGAASSVENLLPRK